MAVLIGVLLALYISNFGTNDVEESTHMSYSAGADLHIRSVEKSGVHTLFGVPVFDTIQGTGDRLPYQASWPQSVTWPLRLFMSWEHLATLRSFIFGTAGLWLTLTAFGSWFSRRSLLRMTVFGALLVSSFGLYVRHNEWSDTYVQTVGVIGVCAFFMHRYFADAASESSLSHSRAMVFAGFVSINGVVTGHPGFWPIALFSWSAIVVALGTLDAFRQQFRQFLAVNWKLITVAIGATLFTVTAATVDLIAELGGKASGRPLSRTQGLFSEHVFVGVYGLSEGGILPDSARKVVSSLLATFLLPAFMMFDSLLPQFLRASEFKEIVRVEFTGSLVLLVVFIGRRYVADEPLRRFIGRVVIAQLMIWVVVSLASRDLLPSVLAPSGAWFFGPVLLAVNVFLTYILIDKTRYFPRLVRLPAYFNLLLVAFWCLVQFGVVSFGLRPEIPERYASWFRGSVRVSESPVFKSELQESERIVLQPLGHWTNYLYFSALHVPVVIPADPKIRDAGHLMPNAAFNNSLMWQALPAEIDVSVRERVFDFLQIENSVVGYSGEDLAVERVIAKSENAVTRNLRSQYAVTHRNVFSVFVMPKTVASQTEVCPVLTFRTSCAVVFSSKRLAPDTHPRLQRCDSDCLWRYRIPDITASDVVVVPVTYDKALVVRDSQNRRVDTVNTGGFLGVGHEAGLSQTELRIDLAPDYRMWLRVLASYVNLLTAAAILLVAVSPIRQLRRVRLRVEK